MYGVIFLSELVYDRAAAVAYARRWALDRNPAYYDFEQIGGDCTNFVSQCLFAGAGVMNYTRDVGWYYRSLSDRAAAWSGVEYLYRFLITNKTAGPAARVVSQEKAQRGDVVQLGREDGTYYHTLLLTEISPQLLVCGHSYDASDRPLVSYAASRIRFLHIETVYVK